MGGNVAYKTINYGSTNTDLDVKVTEKRVMLEDPTQKINGIHLFMTALVQNENFFSNRMLEIFGFRFEDIHNPTGNSH